MRTIYGIRAQLTSGIVIITLAAIGFMGVLSISLLESGALRGKVGEAEKSARLLRMMFFEAGSPPIFPDRAKRVMKNLGISSMAISDGSGKAVFTEGGLPPKGGEVVFFEDNIKIYRAGGGFLKGPGAYLYVTAKGETGAAESVSFTVSLTDIASYASSMRRFIVFYALADSLIIIAFGVYFLSAFIIRPVKRLEGTASRIASGDLEARAEVESKDEIGGLATAFNTMAGRLREEIGRLERTNTELTDAQEELVKARTLASTGSLAAGLAHEIGNPLGAVSGYIEILKKGAAGREEERDMVARMEKEVERINGIVREFLDISRPPKRPSEPADLNTVVKETVEIFSFHRDFKGIRTELRLKEDIPPVMIDRDKLRQVFMNLLINAAEAMGQGGVITVETGRESRPRLDEGKRRRGDTDFTYARRVKEYASVSFIDSGPGIKREDMEKVFDPFFTTKPQGKGVGLGLFISQTIVRAYGGTIEVESEPGMGSAFRVLLEVGG